MNNPITHNYNTSNGYSQIVDEQVKNIAYLYNNFKKNGSHIDEIIYAVQMLAIELSPYQNEGYRVELEKVRAEIKRIKEEVSPEQEEVEVMKLIAYKMQMLLAIMYGQNMMPAKFKVILKLHKGTPSYDLWEKYVARQRNAGGSPEENDPIETESET